MSQNPTTLSPEVIAELEALLTKHAELTEQNLEASRTIIAALRKMKVVNHD